MTTHFNLSIRDTRRPRMLSTAAMVLPLLAFAAFPASAQTAATTGGGSAQSTTPNQAMRAGTTAADRSAGASSAGNGARIAEDDREMMVDLAQANLAEIATGKQALDKSKDPMIDKFAQQMIDDHTKALEDLKAVAKNKGVELPTEPDFAHKAMSTALMATTGDFFDKQYIEHAGVGDHRRTVDLLKKVQREARDADLKRYAGKVLPVVEKHLAMAREMNQKQ